MWQVTHDDGWWKVSKDGKNLLLTRSATAAQTYLKQRRAPILISDDGALLSAPAPAAPARPTRPRTPEPPTLPLPSPGEPGRARCRPSPRRRRALARKAATARLASRTRENRHEV